MFKRIRVFKISEYPNGVYEVKLLFDETKGLFEVSYKWPSMVDFHLFHTKSSLKANYIYLDRVHFALRNFN